jgi:hypothetical protein
LSDFHLLKSVKSSFNIPIAITHPIGIKLANGLLVETLGIVYKKPLKI